MCQDEASFKTHIGTLDFGRKQGMQRTMRTWLSIRLCVENRERNPGKTTLSPLVDNLINGN
ncbi:hypothetical protein IF2G_02140 [Cordyceps javanica]|nr:hypothetical protein IF2G_02140 [Cordyceps javanica]